MKIRLWVSCIVFFNIFATYAQADAVFTDQDQALIDNLVNQSKNYYQSSKVANPSASNIYQQFIESNKSLSHTLTDKTSQVLTQKGQQQYGNADFTKAHFDTLIFASFSLPRQTLEAMYKAASGSERTSIVFRGLPPGCKNINEAIREIQKIAIEMKLTTPPNAVINPVWFEQYNIQSVPTILALSEKTDNQSGNPQNGKVRKAPDVIASVKGLIDPAWIYTKIDEGHKGDLGTQGPVAQIVERDLIEELKDRASKVNWEEKKKNALARVWQNMPIEYLSKATKYRKRLIDPTFEVARDVQLPNGDYIAHKGERINPLERRNFERLLIVFDATQNDEVDFVANNIDRWLESRKLNRRQVKLIMSDYKRDTKWDSYKELQARFKLPLFVLTKEIKDSFVLEHHPSIVYSDDLRFVVEEFDINERN